MFRAWRLDQNKQVFCISGLAFVCIIEVAPG
jgi:hypothetical protein